MTGKRLRYLAEALGAYILFAIFRLMPPDAASNAGGAALRFLGPKMGVSRTARKNISRAFPEKSPQEIEEIVIGMWDNLGRVIAEYPHLQKLWPRLEMRGMERVAAMKGKPAIFFGGHIGNWELHMLAAQAAGFGATLVYRRPNNPWVDRLLQYARRCPGASYVPKGAAGAREILSTLKRGGAVGILVDQKLREGLPVPFFGRDAMTAPAPALFALKLKCPLYPMRVERLGRSSRFRMTAYPPLDVGGADEREILVRMNALLESWIRERPEQWLWIHRRWPE
jgi:KDO2-lipid IV(A) lauroyltransferase